MEMEPKPSCPLPLSARDVMPSLPESDTRAARADFMSRTNDRGRRLAAKVVMERGARSLSEPAARAPSRIRSPKSPAKSGAKAEPETLALVSSVSDSIATSEQTDNDDSLVDALSTHETPKKMRRLHVAVSAPVGIHAALFLQCGECGFILFNDSVDKRVEVCPECFEKSAAFVFMSAWDC